MSELKPVAYMYRDFDSKDDDCGPLLQLNEPSPTWDIIEELYTKEQLHPHVKMTQAEFEEWKDLYNGSLMFSEAIEIMDIEWGNNYKNISEKIWVMDGETNIENEAIFARLYADFDTEHPEETIEIVPEEKWFVVRKLPNTGGNMLKCSDEGLLMYNAIKEVATHFETKEEAEEWTNPLTKAVQLPVE